MKKILMFIIYVVGTLILMFAFFVLYSTLADYKPEPIEKIAESKGEVVDICDTLNVFSWNIGYCGLGDDMSFFYDGGDKMRTSKERTIENLLGILKQIKQLDTIDFYLFQEVDVESNRSYRTNQLESLTTILSSYSRYFTLNYKVDFVPVPVSNPMGKVEGGLASFSNSEPFLVNRISFPADNSWPTGLFMLDRCFMVQRFHTSNGKELLVINTHNSAYDDGTVRKQQMEMLKIFLLNEYKKGNYILVGGDWNQNPPIRGKNSELAKEGRLTRMNIAYDYLPEGWKWQYSEEIPTNRMVDEAYNPETTGTTTIDFYLLSPNLMTVDQNNVDLKFKNSDHNPVLLSFAFVQ